MRRIMAVLCAAALVAGRAAIAQTSAAQPTKATSQRIDPCKAPKVVSSPPASPPESWLGKGPRSATTVLEITVDKKGRVRNPTVVESAGKDVDREAMEAVRRWRFTPAMCGTTPTEMKIHVEMDIHLQ